MARPDCADKTAKGEAIYDSEPERTAQAIRRVSEGDADGLRYLYEHYAPEVYGYVRRIVRDQHDAEDVTQQVFLKLATRLSMYQARRAHFSSWMLRVARNAAIDYMRHRRFTVLEEACDPGLEDSQADAERCRWLREAFGNLTQAQRDVLVLREVAGLTPLEVAERLGKSQAAVNTCYHRARLAARCTLESMESAPVTCRRTRSR